MGTSGSLKICKVTNELLLALSKVDKEQVEPPENDTPIITIVIFFIFLKKSKILCNFIKIENPFCILGSIPWYLV